MNTLKNTYIQYLKQNGIPATIDGEDAFCFFKEYEDRKEGQDHKYIFCDIGKIKQGSIIEALSQNWVCISNPVNNNNAYEKSLIREIKFCLKWQNKAIPCLLDARMQEISENKYLSLAVGNVNITIQETEETKSIKEGDILFVANAKWEVEGIDYSKVGLITLYCKKGVFSVDEKPIWDACNIPHNYSLVITNAETSLTLEDTLQLNIVVKDDGTIVDDIGLIYMTSDNSILEVNSNGLITATGIGVATITVTLAEDSSIRDTITIEVQEPVVGDNYTITISGVNEIEVGNTVTYTTTIYNNNVEVFDKAVSWSIDNTGLAIISSQTGNNCTVVANSDFNIGTVKLRATLVEDGTVFTEKSIIIKSLF